MSPQIEIACPEMVRPRSEQMNTIWSAICCGVTVVRIETKRTAVVRSLRKLGRGARGGKPELAGGTAARTSEYWAVNRSPKGTGVRPRSWLEHPVLVEMVNRRVSGDPTVPTAVWFQQKYFPRPVDLALSLGCGFGTFERFGIEHRIARTFHANDLSEGAITETRAAADRPTWPTRSNTAS